MVTIKRFNELFTVEDTPPIKSPYYEIEIIGDCNDGDYAHAKDRVNAEKFETEYVLALSLFMSKFLCEYGIEEMSRGNYDIVNFIEDNIYIPSDNNGRCHTIESIYVKKYEIDGTIKQVFIEEINLTDEEACVEINAIYNS